MPSCGAVPLPSCMVNFILMFGTKGRLTSSTRTREFSVAIPRIMDDVAISSANVDKDFSIESVSC